MTRFSAADHAPGSGPVKAVPPRPRPRALACGGSALTAPSARRYMAAKETTGKQDQPIGSLHGYRGSLSSTGSGCRESRKAPLRQGWVGQEPR